MSRLGVGDVDDDWLDNLDDLGPDTPPEVIDAGIARLTPLPDDADEGMHFLRASLFLIRYMQSMFIAGRASAQDDLDQAVHAGEEALVRLRRHEDTDPDFETAVL